MRSSRFLPTFSRPIGEVEIVGDQYEPWSDEFILGTDNLGRDMLTRLIYGARNTVGIAFLITALAFVIGALTGMLAATMGGWVDLAMSRIVDILMAIPGLVFVLLALAIFGTSIPVLITVITIYEATRVFRLMRAVAMNIDVMDYVEVAKIRGESLWWIIRREILPNATAPLVAEFGVRFTFTFLFIAGLSFLGLGIQPPIADWGKQGAREFRSHHVQRLYAADAGRSDRASDGERQFRHRLVPSQIERIERMSS